MHSNKKSGMFVHFIHFPCECYPLRGRVVKICLLVNNFFIRCCLKDLAHPANPWHLSTFSASHQIPISHILTELLKIFLPEVGKFLQISAIVVVVVSHDSPPCILKTMFSRIQKALNG